MYIAKVVGGLAATPMQTFLLCPQFAYETATQLLNNNHFRGKIESIKHHVRFAYISRKSHECAVYNRKFKKITCPFSLT